MLTCDRTSIVDDDDDPTAERFGEASGDRSDVHYDRDERRGEDDGKHEQRRARVREERVPARASLLRAGPMPILRRQLFLAAGLGVRGSLQGFAIFLTLRASGHDHGVFDERLAIDARADRSAVRARPRQWRRRRRGQGSSGLGMDLSKIRPVRDFATSNNECGCALARLMICSHGKMKCLFPFLQTTHAYNYTRT